MQDSDQVLAHQAADRQRREEPGSAESLLFVDDERNILSSLRRLFRPLGYQIHVAESGAEGLEILKQHAVDLIISDMRMPEMDGAEFLTKAAQLCPDSVRILLTGFADLSSTIDAINRGKIYRYLSKPWEDTDIVLAVQQGLQTKQLERDKRELLKLTQQQNRELADLNANLEAKVVARTQEIQQTADMLDLAYQQLNDSYKDTIRVVSSLIGMREGLTTRHAQRVADLAKALAKRLQLPENAVRDVYFAGLLHELGKMSLPDVLLERPVVMLNRKGLEKYKRYPLLGQTALASVEALQGAGNLIRSQEEKFDGSGYPDGLQGEGIPLGARILCLVRDFYAYQGGKLGGGSMSAKAALERIVTFSGKLYDPSLVDLFNNLVGDQLSGRQQIRERRIESGHLQPGMKLSRDLLNQAGLLLLTKGRVLTELLIKKLVAVEQSEDEPFEIYVYQGEKRSDEQNHDRG